MADKKYGRVTAIEQVQSDTRLITLRLEEPDSIEFLGGQYVIVHSEAELEPGRVAKGTFTLISPESEPNQITLAVKQVEGGLCTRWLNQSLKVGDRLGYSGPWGAKNYETPVGDVDALFVATDTGINTAIAVLNSRNAAACLARARVVWLVPSSEYFLDVDYVRQRVPEAVCDRFRVEFIADVGVALRVEQALTIVEEELVHVEPRYSLLSGDGDVLLAVRELLLERGLGSGVTMESYFNKPEKGSDLKKNSAVDSQPAPARQRPPKQLPKPSLRAGTLRASNRRCRTGKKSVSKCTAVSGSTTGDLSAASSRMRVTTRTARTARNWWQPWSYQARAKA